MTPTALLRTRAAFLCAASATLLTACGGDDDNTKPSEPAVVAKPLELTIAHVDDSHSNLDSASRSFTLAGQNVSVDAGGFPRVTAMIQAIRANNDNVLALHAGDAITGTLYFNRAGQPGEADAALMNTVCFDAFALGNHEFDKGDSGLKQFIDFLHKDPAQCKTPVLSANVQFGANSALNPQKAPGYVQPHIVVERDGQKIGIVGLTVAGKTKESSSPDPDTTFEKEATAAQRSIDQLKADGVNKIIVMSHIGYEADKALAAQLRGVDVIVGGDSHTLLGPDSLETYKAGSPSGDYPTRLQNADGDNVCLVHANEYAKVVGELKVNFDAEGKVTDCAGTPHVLIGDDYIVNKAAPDAAMLKAIQDDVKASGFLSVVQPDAKALAVLEPFKKLVEVFKAKIVATAPQEICSRRVPGGEGSTDYGRSSAECNAIGDVSLRGGDIQQLVAQAYLDVANQDYGGADFTLQSGGGVRVPLKGEVTAANVIEVLPFGNMLWRLDITGAEAKSMIEDGLDATFKQGGSTGPYPYSAGLRFNVDASQAKGNRASNLQAFDKASNSWKALDMNKTYRLFVLSFNATGGDGYTTLANIPAERRMDIGVLDADVLQTWIDRISDKDASGRAIIRKLPVDQYSTQFFAAP